MFGRLRMMLAAVGLVALAGAVAMTSARAETPAAVHMYGGPVVVNPDVDNVQPIEALRDFVSCVQNGTDVYAQRRACLAKFGGKVPIQFIEHEGERITKRVTVVNFGELINDDQIGLARMSVHMIDQHANVFDGVRTKMLGFAYREIGKDEPEPAKTAANDGGE